MLRKVRKSSRLTQDAVAKSIGISRCYVIKIEKGQAEHVSLNIILNYLNACNVKWTDFFVELKRTLDKINYGKIISEIGLNKATGLTEKQKKKIDRDISYYLMRISGQKGKAKPYSEQEKYKAVVEFGKYRIKIEPIEDEIQKKLGELNVPIAHNLAYKDFGLECYKALKKN
ncbi:MAG: helix-turn-helix domain-containing protein [candidate division WOR-3 bacterium]